MTRIILRPQPPDAIQKDPLGSATNPIPRHGPFSSKLSNMKGVYVVDFRAPMPRDYFAERNQLKNLTKSRSIIINWQNDAESEPQVLMAEFPSRVATHFSDTWTTLFPMIPGYSGRELRDIHPKTITIVGGKPQYHLEILQWMLDCTKGSGLKFWEEYEITDKPFYRYYNLRRSAEIMGCTFLETEFHLRMQAVSCKRIHSDDVAALWAEIPHPGAMADHLANHVASFFVAGANNILPYMRLREALPDLNEAVIAQIGFSHDHVRDPELARAWTSRMLVKEKVKTDDAVKDGATGDSVEEVTEATKEETAGDANEEVTQAAYKKAAVEELELAKERASKIKDRNGRRREKKRLAELARSLAAE